MPMRNIALLVDAICEAYDTKAFRPSDGATHCNEVIQYVCRKFNYTKFYGKVANEIIDIMKAPDSPWSNITPNEAWQAANEGSLVIAGLKAEPHGHVCIVRPGTLEFSGNWKENAPKVMNMGKNCFIDKGANYAFHDKPEYFVLSKV